MLSKAVLPASSSSAEPTLSAPSLPSKNTRGHSCVLCQRRKVRCDRQKPCSNCLKSRAECVPSAPPLPRRRQKKVTETDLLAKVRRYEHLLKNHGILTEEDDDAEGEGPGAEEKRVERHEYKSSRENGGPPHQSMCISTKAPEAVTGALITNKGESHYVENTLWENLREEIEDPRDILNGSVCSDDETNENSIFPCAESFLVGHSPSPQMLTMQHPQPVHIFKLWQTFLVNVNPLVKMVHAPTMQQTILDASGDLENISRPTECLMFAIYLLAVTSLATEDCESMFGDSRSNLTKKYSHATLQALINSKFLKSLNISTLQAFAFYLLAAQKLYDAHSMWVLTGSAVRISQRLGLHRDGSRYKMSPFDAEMRRRTWWQIVFLDSIASKFAGAGFPMWLTKFDTKIPLNISDSDLSPAMKDPPVAKDGATEMMFCALRFAVGQLVRDHVSQWRDAIGNPDMIGKKLKTVDAIEKTLNEKFIRYCDPSIPLHMLVDYTAKSVVCSLKIMARHPRQFPDKGASMSQADKNILFDLSLREVEIYNLSQSVQAIRGYSWHVQHYFQLDAFIHILSELGNRILGEEVERAWRIVQLAYEYHSDMITNTKNALFFATGNLCLKAWRKREEAGLATQGTYHTTPPPYISQLREQRSGSDLSLPSKVTRVEEAKSSTTQGLEYPTNISRLNNHTQLTNQYIGMIDTGYSDVEMPEITQDDWIYWNTIMDGDLPAHNSQDSPYFN
ncbi:hypothetical protein HYALB_00001361 [Hymenoscyphus albidus]|uniref:Zn(2)-C6 fungal-type domain-containing protein n=1 Tax=Hymenoscyphus albidus TaxID=595503 RepID=A0A9N9LHZ2_9HELO|nr:hypothetical protein HYALB_00001361 [Hymenoscyphus albidus]